MDKTLFTIRICCSWDVETPQVTSRIHLLNIIFIQKHTKTIRHGIISVWRLSCLDFGKKMSCLFSILQKQIDKVTHLTEFDPDVSLAFEIVSRTVHIYSPEAGS